MKDWTGLHPGVRCITGMYKGVSTRGTDKIVVQLGTAIGFVTTGYVGSASVNGTVQSAITAGLATSNHCAAADRIRVTMTLEIKLTHLIAGVEGGIVRAFLRAATGWAAVSFVILGSLTADDLTMPFYSAARAWIPALSSDTSSEHTIGFLVGLTAMLISEGVFRAADGWSRNPKLPTN